MPRSRMALSLASAILLALPLTAPAALADSSREKRTGDYGQRVIVSKTEDLNPTRQRIIVRGRNFDPRVGIYVGLCVQPPKGRKPTPCGGGIDMQGSTGSSAWISSNPPPYARSLVTPFKKKGRFRTAITVSSKIGDVDCRLVKCAIAVRADHLRSRDRSHDVIIPVDFR
ncbi:MAG TPA: hypothetical protein VGP37_06075 [Candidatus Nanopelagicales bacterium]|nr:hypothetical protein [Candidatus Nanopelagicales bacterium]